MSRIAPDMTGVVEAPPTLDAVADSVNQQTEANRVNQREGSIGMALIATFRDIDFDFKRPKLG